MSHTMPQVAAAEIANLKAKLQTAQSDLEKQAKDTGHISAAKIRNIEFESKRQLKEALTQVENLREEISGKGDRFEMSAVERYEASQLVKSQIPTRPC